MRPAAIRPQGEYRLAKRGRKPLTGESRPPIDSRRTVVLVHRAGIAAEDSVDRHKEGEEEDDRDNAISHLGIIDGKDHPRKVSSLGPLHQRVKLLLVQTIPLVARMWNDPTDHGESVVAVEGRSATLFDGTHRVAVPSSAPGHYAHSYRNRSSVIVSGTPR